MERRRARIDSIDIMRGLIMVVMALDHTREFWTNARFDPTDAETTTVAYFFTRWVTHLCAPWFMLLAGTGASLSLGRGRDKAGLTKFLVTRGLWLIFLELTIVNFGWKGATFDPTFVRFMVLCALGGSMIVLAALVHVPRWAILAFAVVLIVGHDALDKIEPEQLGSFAWLWNLLHVPGMIGAEPHLRMFVLYPLVPWVGVMALGYCAGPWITSLAPERRARTFALIGVALLAVFAILRGLDVYGDPDPWKALATSSQTAMSFLDLSKYPPSVDYLLATVGVGLLVLAAIEATHSLPVWRMIRTFGRVPMFFYLVHIALISGTWEVVHRVATGHWRTATDDWGFGLGVVYLVWIAYIVALYPLCRWYEGVKARRRAWWLGYL